jgi:sRNA-binding protein
MAKDRNTFAKRQREVEKKRKAEQKRQRRAQKKQEEESEAPAAEDSTSELTAGERSVLKVFQTYLMTPGKMLCFGSSDLDSLRVPLTRLTERGLLVSEKNRGGYSLTQSGFDAMREQA